MRGYVLLCLALECLVALTSGSRSHYRRQHHHHNSHGGEMHIKIFPEGPHTPSCDHGSTVANANRQFAVKLYKKLKRGNSNIILSPFSISTVMAMTYAGANGTTKTQMSKALQFEQIPYYCNVDQGFKDVLHALTASGHNHTLNIANRVFVESKFSLLESYEHVTKDYYGSKADVVPFSSMPEGSRFLINNWVSGQTDGKITDLIPSGGIGNLTVLVLVNAITFKGYWKYEFTAGATKVEPFHQSSTTSVNMMHFGCGAKSLRYAYVKSIKSQVVELPFYNSKIVMYIVLPRKHLSLSKVEKKFSWNPDKLKLKTRKLLVSLPKFTIKKDTTVTRFLKAMGIRLLFKRRKSDLSKIAGSSVKLYVLDVFHQAFINVHERGTEASAATAAVICIPPPPRARRNSIKFVANRPFLFFIWDKETGSLLFNGRFKG